MPPSTLTLPFILAFTQMIACLRPDPRPRAGRIAIASHRAVGCWWLELERRDTTYVRWPALVRLDTTPTQWQTDYVDLQVAIDSGSQTGRRLFISWAPMSSDLISLVVGDGLSGIDYRLSVIHADTLRGGGAIFVDFSPALPGFARSITAVRAGCDARWLIVP